MRIMRKIKQTKVFLCHYLIRVRRDCFETVSLNTASSSHYAMIFVIPLPIINTCKTGDLARLSSDQSTLENTVSLPRKRKF